MRHRDVPAEARRAEPLAADETLQHLHGRRSAGRVGQQLAQNLEGVLLAADPGLAAHARRLQKVGFVHTQASISLSSAGVSLDVTCRLPSRGGP